MGMPSPWSTVHVLNWSYINHCDSLFKNEKRNLSTTILDDLLVNKYLAQFHQIHNLQLFYEFQGQYRPVCTHGASMAFVVGLLALVTGEKNSDIAPRKEIKILESGKFLLVEYRILEISLVETRLLGSGIRNTAQGIQIAPSIGFWNQRSTDKKSGIQYLESGIHSVESRVRDSIWFSYMGQQDK